MYIINYKKLRKDSWSGILFLMVGLLFLAIFMFMIINTQSRKYEMDSETQAIDIRESCHYDSDNDYVCSPIYVYMVNDNTYSCKSNISSSVSTTKNKTIYYDSNNPSNCLTSYELKSNKIVLFFMILPIILIVIGIVNIIKSIKKRNNYKYLSNNGTLYRGLSYELVPASYEINGVRPSCPQVKFTLPNGNTVLLKGDPFHDNVVGDSDGCVDLLIDLNNPKNYYIDLEIKMK